MNELHKTLTESLQTGFIDKFFPSKKEYLPEILANDRTRGKKVLTSLIKSLKSCDEYWFSVAFVTRGGVAALINLLDELDNRGVKGKLLVSQYLNFTQPEALKTLLRFKNIDLKIVVEGEFHAKGYLFRKGNHYDLIIGSSNLTARALCSNKEWNLKISATPESRLINDALAEFKSEFDNAVRVDEGFIAGYEHIYYSERKFFYENRNKLANFRNVKINPNKMQADALQNLKNLRENQKEKALLISATGTGKTYLSAFDALAISPEKFLFIVHRRNIAETAMESFRKIFGPGKQMGLYSGKRKELEADYIFSTIQTISLDKNLQQFDPKHFDYIVIDETHRAGAPTYQKILQHFEPKFLLGMTATPERTDGADIFGEFDHNIAYEIRLQQALEEEMLCPFHYYGVTDITVGGQPLEESSDFSKLTATERVDHIIKKAEFYGCDNGCVRGLIFCRSVAESNQLSSEFNLRGYRTVSLSGASSEDERVAAIRRLESDNEQEKLDYIFTVDIFNEGIDIPRVNQVIMLRPTQSAIIFVQQLGRGLRKTDKKEYLTVIDFIGNYNNNYIIPVALYGDTSYNKDHLRKMMVGGSSLIPGASTINFDEISRERIFKAIDTSNLSLYRDLKKDYELLKFKIGRPPMMVDFIEHGSRDPQLYVTYSKSYFNFIVRQEKLFENKLSERETKLLELFSGEIANGKRIEEVIILRELLKDNKVSRNRIKDLIREKYDIQTNDQTIESCLLNLNFEFVTERSEGQEKIVREIYNLNIVEETTDGFKLANKFFAHLENPVFAEFLSDVLNYSEKMFDKCFEREKFVDGFILYQKCSRKDVFRILNWEKNPLAQNVGGYMINPDKTNCPIFVNYHKAEDISETTRYEDSFINNYEFEWMSKSNRTLNSPDVVAIRKSLQTGMRLPLFIKKSNDEGIDFYYMGDVNPMENSFEQTTLKTEQGQDVSVVKLVFKMKHPVEDSIYEYLTTPLSSSSSA